MEASIPITVFCSCVPADNEVQFVSWCIGMWFYFRDTFILNTDMGIYIYIYIYVFSILSIVFLYLGVYIDILYLYVWIYIYTYRRYLYPRPNLPNCRKRKPCRAEGLFLDLEDVYERLGRSRALARNPPDDFSIWESWIWNTTHCFDILWICCSYQKPPAVHV